MRRCPKSAPGAPRNALGALSGGLLCGSLAAWHEDGGTKGAGTRGVGTKGKGTKGEGARRRSADMGPDFRLGEPDQGGQLPEGKLVLTPELLGQPDPAGPIQPARIAGSEHLLASVSA